VIGKSAPIVPRSGLHVALGFFAAGAAAGYAFGSRSQSSLPISGPAPTRAEVRPVRGEGPQQVSPPALAPAARAMPPTIAPSATSREVARTATAITAWISGGGSYGAGFVLSDRHVLTCLHVVEKMKDIELSVAGGPWQAAKLLEKDRELDLALLTAELVRPARAELASVVTMEMGDPVFAMGTPRRLGFSLASGVVSFVGRPYDDVFYLQTDVPTNPGSSGGPVLDAQGRVVGISSFILRDSQGLAFALPIDYALRRFRTELGARLDAEPFESWLQARAGAGSEEPAGTRAVR
jgi:S1-C subfamily serine protease